MSPRTWGLLPTVVSLIVAGAGCDSRTPVGVTGPNPSEPSPPASLSGQVFEISAAGRSPADGVTVFASVLTTSGSRRTATYHQATTGPDGRYLFTELTYGSVSVRALAPNSRQVCAAGAELGPATQLDVEITSSANPQPSPAPSPLRITGQIYEMTQAGRVGFAGWSIGIDRHAPDLAFLTVHADANGYYTACGIPAHWPILFDIGNEIYEAVSGAGWHQFSGDTTVDIEMRRVQ